MRRIGLGCLRLAESGHSAEISAATVRAAIAAGVRVLDVARSYSGSEALAAGASIPIVTKCGMTRPQWIPDGRAGAILADAAASVEALGREPDYLLLHAPDPNVELAVSVRALTRAPAKAIGLSNVTRGQLESVSAKISAVEVALGPYDDAAARGGVVAWCKENGALFLAHSPLGGPSKVRRLERDGVLGPIAQRHRTSVPVLMLAYLLALDETIIPLVGARTPEALAEALTAENLELDTADLARLDARFPGLALVRHRPLASPTATAEVVILMGIPGSGKSKRAEDYVARGYTRLNRDLLGGSLKGIARRLAGLLEAGTARIVLDNTYVARASRSEILRIAHTHGALVRCVHIETSLADAQINLTQRMLERHDALLGGRELLAKKDPGLFAPPALFRMARQLEAPAADEGFATIERVPFVRVPSTGRPALFLPIELARPPHLALMPEAPLLVFGWNAVARTIDRPHEVAICPHGGGPPTCWCRPPLPGLLLAFARRNGIDLRASLLVAESPAQRTMGTMLGMNVT